MGGVQSSKVTEPFRPIQKQEMQPGRSELNIVSKAEILKKRGYKILSKVGEGTYAKVYLGKFESPGIHTIQNAPVYLAVKIITTRQGPSEFTGKFLPRELNILSHINHPHIIHIHSILQIGQNFYIFMRHAEQGDLLEFILKNGTIQENQARVWTRQIALALQYLQVLNIAHRDMKCENILITANFNVKLSDFGFARYTVDANRKPILSETYCGSLSYAAPEILLGCPYNPRMSDIWSLGVVIYVMLNKSMPYVGNNPKALHENQMKQNFKFRTKVVDLLSDELKELITNLLEPDPMKRYPIEGVINSTWIAMDRRLIGLSPIENAALHKAFEFPVAPPENLTLQQLRTVAKKSSKLVMDAKKLPSENKIEIIKSYDRPRIGDRSKKFTM